MDTPGKFRESPARGHGGGQDELSAVWAEETAGKPKDSAPSVGLEARKSKTFGRSRNPWRGGGDATQPGREQPARPLASGQSPRAKGGLIPRRETPALCPGLAPTEGRKGQKAPCDRELRLLPL